MGKKAQISAEHKRAMVACLNVRLAHVISLKHDLGTGDGLPKYIRIGGSKTDEQFYPNATPIYEIVGLTHDDMIQNLGAKWATFFKSNCSSGFRIQEMNRVYFVAVPGGDESIAPDETNVVTSNNWGKNITKAIKAARGCGNDAALPKLKKQKTDKKDDDSEANASTRSVPQTPKDGAPAQGNGAKRKAVALEDSSGETSKRITPPSTKRNNSLKASIDVQLDMDGIASEVFGLLMERFKQNINIPPDCDVEQLALEVLIELASKGNGNSAEITSKTRDGRRKTRRFTLHPTRRKPICEKSTQSSQSRYIRTKAELILNFVESVLQ